MKKKQTILLVCRLLETETDCQHYLTQTKIAQIISNVYPCDRKTVGRNIAVLKEIGFPIVKTTKGYYMDKKMFSEEDKIFIKKAIMSSNEKTIEQKQLILKNLSALLEKPYIINELISNKY